MADFSVEVEDMCYRRVLVSDVDGDKTEAYFEIMEEELGTVCNPIKVVFVPSVSTPTLSIKSGDLVEQGLKDESVCTLRSVYGTSYAAAIEERCDSPGDTIGFLPAFGYVLAHNLCDVEPGLASTQEVGVISREVSCTAQQRSADAEDLKVDPGESRMVFPLLVSSPR